MADVPETLPDRKRKVKITVTLTQEQYDDLAAASAARGSTLSATVTRGIALQRFLLERKGATLLLRTGDKVQEIILDV